MLSGGGGGGRGGCDLVSGGLARLLSVPQEGCLIKSIYITITNCEIFQPLIIRVYYADVGNTHKNCIFLKSICN